MADEYHQLGSGNWWNNSSSTARNRFDGAGTTPSPSISTTLNAIGSFGRPTEMVDMVQSRPSSMDSVAVSGVLAANPELQMMGLGLSSQNMNWNQALLEGKGCDQSTLGSLLQEDLNSSSGGFQQESVPPSSQENWREGNEFKRTNRGFSLDQQQFVITSNDSSTITSQNLTTGFPPLLLSENQQQATDIYLYPTSSDGHGATATESNRFLQFLRATPPQQLHFSNNTAFWNASTAPVADARPSFYPASQRQKPPAPSFDEKPKNTPEVRDLGATTKKTSTELTSNKRPRSETTSPSPAAFKVRKEKMGDRITALQQLVSPFGKTDTASVLSEVIQNIKFLHQQISVLSTPYMKHGAPVQHQQLQNSNKSKDQEGPQQDLRSRGLCLVPVSSTFPLTHETSVDFWTPTFGGTFR